MAAAPPGRDRHLLRGCSIKETLKKETQASADLQEATEPHKQHMLYNTTPQWEDPCWHRRQQGFIIRNSLAVKIMQLTNEPGCPWSHLINHQTERGFFCQFFHCYRINARWTCVNPARMTFDSPSSTFPASINPPHKWISLNSRIQRTTLKGTFLTMHISRTALMSKFGFYQRHDTFQRFISSHLRKYHLISIDNRLKMFWRLAWNPVVKADLWDWR